MSISAYLSIFDDWDILEPALRSIDAIADEIVVVDGAYDWMVPALGQARPNASRSRDEVYEILAGFGRKLRIVGGLWKNETDKRRAGFETCRGRYVLRADADEIVFWDEPRLEAFLASGCAVAETEIPLYVSPGLIRAASPTAPMERLSFLFDKSKVSAQGHLRHLWLVMPDREREMLGDADHGALFPEPVAFTAHLSHWRSPQTAAGRARFYVMNYIRTTGRLPWVPQFHYTDDSGFSPLFDLVGADAFHDIMLGRDVVAGLPPLEGMIVRPSGRPEDDERSLAPLYDNLLRGLTLLNDKLSIRPRAIANEAPYFIDASTDRSLDRLRAADGAIALTFADEIHGAGVTLSQLSPDGTITSGGLPVSIAGRALRFGVPRIDGAEPQPLRQTVSINIAFGPSVLTSSFRAASSAVSGDFDPAPPTIQARQPTFSEPARPQVPATAHRSPDAQMKPPVFRYRRLVIKADDFGRGASIDPWRRFVDLCLDCGIVPSIGIVAGDFARSSRLQSIARHFQDDYGVEFWNHSFSHQDMRKMSRRERERDTQAAQDTIQSVLGRYPAVYGAPFNFLDDETAADIQAAGDFQGFFFRDPDGAAPGCIPGSFLLSPEISTQVLRPINLGYFEKLYARHDSDLDLVMQVHPDYWSRDCFDDFAHILARVLDDGFQPLTAWELLRSRLPVHEQPAESLDRGTMLAVSERVIEDTADDQTLNDRAGPVASGGGFGQLRQRIVGVSHFLQRHGLVPWGRSRDDWRFVDIGAGIGHWAMAAKAANHGIAAFALDRDAALLERAAAAYGRYIAEPFCKFLRGPADALPFETASVDAVVCSNALNAMPAWGVLQEVARVCKSSAPAYIAIHNALSPISDMLRCLASGEDAATLDWVDRIIGNAARRAGVTGDTGPAAYWDDFEFVRLAHFAGLHPRMRGIETPETTERLMGVPTIWGYLLTPTNRSRERGAALRAGRGATADDLSALIAAGATEAAWALAAHAPELLEGVPNAAGLLLQAAAHNGEDADATLARARDAGLAVSAALADRLRATLPLVAGRNWPALAKHHRDRGDLPAYRLAAWLGHAGLDSQGDAALQTGWLAPIGAIGHALAEGDRPAIKHAVMELFDCLGSRLNILRTLGGNDPQMADFLDSGETERMKAEAERNSWLVKMNLNCFS